MYRIFSSLGVVLAGLLLLSDVTLDFLGITFDNIYGFNSTSNFVFFVSQWISYLLIIVMVQLKPYRLSYISPIYINLLSLYWLFFSIKGDTKEYFYISVFGASILFLLLITFISFAFRKEKEENERVQFLEKFFDLTVLMVRKRNEVRDNG
ncbi:hypothetical protein BWK59_11670 [Flavobacterium davisii]|uniref:Uncharacterized protein n=1 Tax=Flavobacterium davisii TaxID=2906077 RepID=A0A246GGG9_9FLAO|nr:hypothetical protein [Flavobacterium davisii]OWP83228.1 hypothetical protein BWK59_11670 [Flavobacterium davisii]